MTDIGISEESSESTIAFSEPFSLLTPRAIEGMRRELLIDILPGGQIDGTLEYQEIKLPRQEIYLSLR
jgi:hypothetical protein